MTPTLPMTLAAAIEMEQQIAARLERAQTPSSMTRLGGQLAKIRRGILLMEAGEDPKHLSLHRFLAFVLLTSVSLPRDHAKIPALAAELKLLGAEMLSLSASGVYEPEITGSDFL